MSNFFYDSVFGIIVLQALNRRKLVPKNKAEREPSTFFCSDSELTKVNERYMMFEIMFFELLFMFNVYSLVVTLLII